MATTQPGSSGGLSDAGSAPRPLRIDIITVLPAMLVGPLDHGVIGRAQRSGLVDVRVHDLRDWTTDRHRTTDDCAFGGGGGMVMTPGPLFAAVEALLGLPPSSARSPERAPCPVVLMSPQGRRFDHARAVALAAHDRIVLIAGRYEGVDERVRTHLATEELSIGDYVLTGGELAALVVADAVARLRPGVVGLPTATATDSFAHGLLEHPHYTRPADFRGWAVPTVLVSGHHAEVARWRRRASLLRTYRRRPDLLAGVALAPAEARMLADADETECPGEMGPELGPDLSP